MNPNQQNRLFGFSYKEDPEQIKKMSPVPPNADDGVAVAAGGLYGYGVNLDEGATTKGCVTSNEFWASSKVCIKTL